MFDWWFRIRFWKRVVLGFVLGALAGWLFGPDAERWFGPLGRIAKARILSGFTRQRLRPFTSVGRRQDLLALADLLATGEVAPAIDRTYPLEAAAEALAHVGAGHTRGKVVVAV